jgi:uncharacterized protein YjiS (DUF1127 family)
VCRRDASPTASIILRLLGGIAGDSDREVRMTGQRFLAYGAASSLAVRFWTAFLRAHFGRPIRAIVTEFGARCAINHLRSLDDDRLRDLGLERKEIERFVRFGRD